MLAGVFVFHALSIAQVSPNFAKIQLAS